MQYKGLDSENRVFENFKTANKSRLALMQKIRDNLEKEDENKDYTDTTNNIKSMLTTHNMLEKIVYSLESEKQKYGANSKQYKDLVAKYQEVNPIAKEYNITDYVSLAKYYDLQSSEILSLNS